MQSSIRGVGRAEQGWHAETGKAEAGRSQTPDVTANPKNREQAQPALKGDCTLSHSMLAEAQGAGAQDLKGLA